MRSLLKWTWRIAAVFLFLTTPCIIVSTTKTVAAMPELSETTRDFSSRCDFGKNLTAAIGDGSVSSTPTSCQGWTWSRHFRVGVGPVNLTTGARETPAPDKGDTNEHGLSDNNTNYDGYFLYYDGSTFPGEDIPQITSPRLESSPFRHCEIEYLIYQSGDPGPGVRYDLVLKNYQAKHEPTTTFLGGYQGQEMEVGKWVQRRQTIGQRKLPFQIIFEIRTQGENGVKVAIDNIELINCSKADSNPTCSYTCQAKDAQSDAECLDRSRICNLVKDCPLGDDEMQNCDQVPKYAKCDFEEELSNGSVCEGWLSPPSLEDGSYWERARVNVEARGKLGPFVGDHTFNNISGHFLTARYAKRGMGNKAALFTALFNAPLYFHRDPNSSYKHSCTARFFYFMYGKNMGHLIVRVEEKAPHGFYPRESVELKESAVDAWQKMVITIPSDVRNNFRLSFTAEQGMSPRAKPAIDDFTLSPECFGINVPESEPRVNTSEPPSWVAFGTCGATGHEGPNTKMCHNWHYRVSSVTAVPATVNVTFGGVQVYRVPASGFYTIFAYGAVGGLGLKNKNVSGGKADYVRAIVYVRADEELYVVIGQRGKDADSFAIQNDQWMDRVEKIGRRKNGNLGGGLDELRKGSPTIKKENAMEKKIHYGIVKRGLEDLKVSTNPKVVLREDEAGGGGGGGATYVFKNNGDDLVLLLVAAGGGGLSTLPPDDPSQRVNPDARGRQQYQSAGIGAFESGRAGGGGSFGNFVHNYTASGRSVTLSDNSGQGGHACKKTKVYGGNGGFGGGGGGCEGGGGGGGYKGGDGGTGLKVNGQGGYSYITNEAQLQSLRVGIHENNGYVLLAMALPGQRCHCAHWCVYIDEEGQEFDCACDSGYALDKDRKTCLDPITNGPTRLSLHHLIVIILCILVSAAVILFFFCLAFNRFRKTRAGAREACPEGPSNAEVQLSRLRAQAAGAGGGMVTEYNPNYEFGGSTCTLQDLKEIPRENLTLVKALGQGAFGEVYQGYLANVPGESTELTVAVKTLPEAASAQAEQDFFTEAMIMSKFNHPNIVRFIGVCFDKLPRFIVLELLQGGDLKSFLREFRPKPNIPPTLTMADLLRLASDVAKGCQYLEENHFIHRDIAARNCLLTTKSPSGIVKIADFGMARDIYRADYYRKGGKAMLPVKWMPPEAFMDGVFTSKTDIWSFGVLLWEVMSLGYMPYPGRGNQEVMQLVTSGRRLEAPRGCPGPVYHLMTQCWHPVPEERPTFGTILERLGYCTQDPDVISTPLPVFDRPPSMEKDATIMRPSSDSAETCLQSPGSEDYLIPMPSSNYSLGTVLSDLQSGSTSVDSMDRLLGGPSGVRSSTTNNPELTEGGPAPALPPRAPNIVFSPTDNEADGNALNCPEGTWETSFSTSNTEFPSKMRSDGYSKIPIDENQARASSPLLLANAGTKASSTLSLDALPTVPPAPSATPEKKANLTEGARPNDEAETPLLVKLDDSPTPASVYDGNHIAVNPLQTLDAAALSQSLQNTPNRLSYANVDVSAKNNAILDTTELPFPGDQSARVNC